MDHLIHFNNQESANNSDEINIFVNEKLISLNSLDPIYQIDKIMGIHNTSYILNGNVLIPSLSLKFSGVKNGDRIFTSPKKDNCDLLNQLSMNKRVKSKKSKVSKINKLKEIFEKNWSQKYRDPDSIFEQLIFKTDPATVKESAKISDLFRFKMENNRLAFRKICNKYTLDNNESFLAHHDTNIRTIIPSKSFSPSTELLPNFF